LSAIVPSQRLLVPLELCDGMRCTGDFTHE
jgi:hypothetical protein